MAYSDAEEIREYNGTTGAFMTTFVNSTACHLCGPQDLVFGPDGNLYTTSPLQEVLEFNGSTGAFVRTFVSFQSGGIEYPQGLAFGPDGNLYVASQGSGDVLEYDGTTGAFLRTFVSTGSAGISFPFDIAFHTPSTPEPGSLLLAAGFLAALALRRALDVAPITRLRRRCGRDREFSAQR